MPCLPTYFDARRAPATPEAADDMPDGFRACVIGPARRTAVLTEAETHAVALYFDAALRALTVPGVADLDADAAWTKLRDAGLIPAGRRGDHD